MRWRIFSGNHEAVSDCPVDSGYLFSPSTLKKCKSGISTLSCPLNWRAIYSCTPACSTGAPVRVRQMSRLWPRVWERFRLVLSLGGEAGCSRSPARTRISPRRGIPPKSDSEQSDALDKCLPFPSLLALFENSYLVTNVNCSGDERRLANSENRFPLINDHENSL